MAQPIDDRSVIGLPALVENEGKRASAEQPALEQVKVLPSRFDS